MSSIATCDISRNLKFYVDRGVGINSEEKPIAFFFTVYCGIFTFGKGFLAIVYSNGEIRCRQNIKFKEAEQIISEIIKPGQYFDYIHVRSNRKIYEFIKIDHSLQGSIHVDTIKNPIEEGEQTILNIMFTDYPKICIYHDNAAKMLQQYEYNCELRQSSALRTLIMSSLKICLALNITSHSKSTEV